MKESSYNELSAKGLGHMVDGVRSYIEDGRPPGGFLRALFSNDLMAAFARADISNTARMRFWVEWLDNHAPLACYGSKEAVDKWIRAGGAKGLSAN